MPFFQRGITLCFRNGILTVLICIKGHPSGSVVKNLPANAGDSGLIPGPERSLGEGNDNWLQCSWLENPMDRGAWRATVHGVEKESDMTKQQQICIKVKHANVLPVTQDNILYHLSPQDMHWLCHKLHEGRHSMSYFLFRAKNLELHFNHIKHNKYIHEWINEWVS